MRPNGAAALGVYQALRDHGLRVPQDVSVIGCDDINAEWAYPPMTVVSLQLREAGRELARLAVASLREDAQPPEADAVCVPAKLVVRKSTGPARRQRRNT
jgi:LacI family transcriptional regulator